SPSPSPTTIWWTGTLSCWSTRRMLRRSFSSSFIEIPEESSATTAMPARPEARKSIFWLRGSIWTGSSSTFQPRRMDCIAASAAPGCPLIRPKAARSALRARIIIAMRMPIARPMKMPYQGLSSTRALTRTPRTIAPAMAPIIHGSVERSTSWVYLYTSTICLMRPFFGVPSGFSFCFFFEPFSGLVSGVRALWGAVLSGRASARGGLLDAGDDARGFLTGGLVRIEVEEVLRDLAAELPHRLRPELPGAVGGADHRPGHDGEEAHLLGGGRERDELLGLDPAVDR